MFNWDYKYFRPSELLSPDGIALLERGILPISSAAIHKLIRIREFFNTPFYVNHGWLTLRGWRSPAENYSIHKDYRFSFHTWCAFDVTQDELPQEEFYQALKDKKNLFGVGGLGLYKASNFVHIDFRDSSFATWQK